MPFDHTAHRAQVAACIDHAGEDYLCGAVAFAATRREKPRADGLGGTVTDIELIVTRSAFSVLPTEGSVITGGASSADAWRIVSLRPGAAGQLIIVVTAEIH